MTEMSIVLSETQKAFLEHKADECGCSEEEFLHILIDRDMEYDCRYLMFDEDGPGCRIDNDVCARFRANPVWLKGHECEKAIDYEHDLATVDRQRGVC